MEIGREFQCEIEKTVFGGDGLARVGGEVVFIPRTLPGERLIARVTACKSSFSRADCRYLHADYAYETGLKAAQLADQLAQAGLEPAPGVLESPVAPEPPLGYRNKIVLHVHKVGGRTMLGYVMGDNTTVTDIEACPLAHPEINAKLAGCAATNPFCTPCTKEWTSLSVGPPPAARLIGATSPPAMRPGSRRNCRSGGFRCRAAASFR